MSIPLFITSVLSATNKENMRVVKININNISCVIAEADKCCIIHMVGGTTIVLAQPAVEILEKIDFLIVVHEEARRRKQ